MHLSPVPRCKLNDTKNKSVTWSDAQEQSVSELISEASALLDTFDQVSSLLLLPPSMQSRNLQVVNKLSSVELPVASKWNPTLKEHCQNLAIELAKFKPHKF